MRPYLKSILLADFSRDRNRVLKEEREKRVKIYLAKLESGKRIFEKGKFSFTEEDDALSETAQGRIDNY